jgi:hypothetical protein
VIFLALGLVLLDWWYCRWLWNGIAVSEVCRSFLREDLECFNLIFKFSEPRIGLLCRIRVSAGKFFGLS